MASIYFDNAAFSLNMCQALYTRPCYRVQVGPVRLNYLERGYICRDSDVLQNAGEWWGGNLRFPPTHEDRHAFTCPILAHTHTHTQAIPWLSPCLIPQGLGNSACQASAGMSQLTFNINTGQQAYWQPDRVSEKCTKWSWRLMTSSHCQLEQIQFRQLCCDKLCWGLYVTEGSFKLTAMTSSAGAAQSTSQASVKHVVEEFHCRRVDKKLIKSWQKAKRKEESYMKLFLLLAVAVSFEILVYLLYPFLDLSWSCACCELVLHWPQLQLKASTKHARTLTARF